MSRRLHSDVAAIGLSVVGLASAVVLLGKAVIEFFNAVRCGDDCDHIEAGES